MTYSRLLIFYRIFLCGFAVLFLTPGHALSADEVSEEAPQETIEFIAAPDDRYQIMAGDVLSVVVYGEDSLSNKYQVSGEGDIVFPLIGTVKVQSMTANGVAKVLHDQLTQGYLVDPNITVSIASHRPFYILGEVRAPGSYGYVADINVMNAVALAGGFTYRANRERVKILRADKEDKPSNYEDMLVDAKVNPGDIILIKERFF